MRTFIPPQGFAPGSHFGVPWSESGTGAGIWVLHLWQQQGNGSRIWGPSRCIGSQETCGQWSELGSAHMLGAVAAESPGGPGKGLIVRCMLPGLQIEHREGVLKLPEMFD